MEGIHTDNNCSKWLSEPLIAFFITGCCWSMAWFGKFLINHENNQREPFSC